MESAAVQAGVAAADRKIALAEHFAIPETLQDSARLQVILGHLGEGLPISMWRIDNRNAWVEGSRGHKAQHPIAYTSTATCT
jgi:hypothetical protein